MVSVLNRLKASENDIKLVKLVKRLKASESVIKHLKHLKHLKRLKLVSDFMGEGFAFRVPSPFALRCGSALVPAITAWVGFYIKMTFQVLTKYKVMLIVAFVVKYGYR